jgi:hypothetical protein
LFHSTNVMSIFRKMDRDKMSNIYGGPSIDASYQGSVHLAEVFRRHISVIQFRYLYRDNRFAKWTETWYDASMGGSLWRLLISSQSINKYGCHRQFIRNKNCLWWPYLLTDRDEMSILSRGPSIDASYQDSVHLAKRFQMNRNLIGSIYGMFSIKIAHFVPIH